MRVIKKPKLVEFYEKHLDAKDSLERWFKIVRENDFNNITDLRRVFPSADPVECEGKTRTVFNIKNNKYRLIVRINYQMKIIYLLYFLTHAEYDKGFWKN